MDTTREHKEKMYEEVLKYVSESYKNNPNEITATISTKSLDDLTGLNLDENYVIENEEQLSKNYGHLSTAYGFNSFYDLYMFAKSNDEYEQVAKGGQKDLSKLRKVKRTVVRNGKQTTMTFYEDPNAEEDKNDQKDKPKEEITPQSEKASEMIGTVIGEVDKKVMIRDLKLLVKLGSKSGISVDTTCDSYITLTNSNNELKGIIGFTKDNKYVTLKHLDSKGLEELDKRAYYELIKLALTNKLGAKLPTPKDELVNLLAEEDGFKEKGNMYQIEYKDLIKSFGENSV